MADLRGYVEGLIGFEGDGTNVVANPTGTPTDDLETVQIGETIYNVGGGGESIVPTPTNVDRGKYLGVKSNTNELEYREVKEVPSTEGASAGTVLTHTISGESWLPPAKELPTYTSGDNGKVLGVSSGVLAWVEQSGGRVVYSTTEQEIGTWIDGSIIYEKSFINLSQATQGSDWISISGVYIPNIENVIECKAWATGGANEQISVALAEYSAIENGVRVTVFSDSWNRTINTITIQYTKME